MGQLLSMTATVLREIRHLSYQKDGANALFIRRDSRHDHKIRVRCSEAGVVQWGGEEQVMQENLSDLYKLFGRERISTC